MFFRSNRALTGDTALQLRANFLCGLSLQRIGASASDQPDDDGKRKREAFHLAILGSRPFNASAGGDALFPLAVD
jgi:hypothetical protein